MPYCFPRSPMKFQGHTGWKIDDLDQIWARLLGRSQLSNPSDLPCSLWNCIQNVNGPKMSVSVFHVTQKNLFRVNKPSSGLWRVIISSRVFDVGGDVNLWCGPSQNIIQSAHYDLFMLFFVSNISCLIFWWYPWGQWDFWKNFACLLMTSFQSLIG